MLREKIYCLNLWHARLSDRASRQERKHEGNFTKGNRAKTAPQAAVRYRRLVAVRTYSSGTPLQGIP